jgi:hypothetical protein
MNANGFHGLLRYLLANSELMNVARESIEDGSYNPTVSTADESVSIDAIVPEDWPAVRMIYLEGIATGNATFETSVPEWEKWDAAHIASCRLGGANGRRSARLGSAQLSFFTLCVCRSC